MTDSVPDRASARSAAFDEDLLVALRELPRRQRAVVVLRYVEDLDVDAVARLLDISPGTVKSQAARGLDTLRDRLGAPTGAATGRDGESR